MDTPTATVNPTTIIGHAKKSFARLATVFTDQTNKRPPHHAGGPYPNFWQIGCTFDTILDYFLVLKEAEPKSGVDTEPMMLQAIKGYQYGIVGLAAAWYDDWCWWGIAACKAFDKDYEDFFGKHTEYFRDIALAMWKLADAGDFTPAANLVPDTAWNYSALMKGGHIFTKQDLIDRAKLHNGSPNTWTTILRGRDDDGTPRQNSDYKYFTSQVGWAVPRFNRGCWQYDMSSLPFPEGDGPDWQDPDPKFQSLGVFQLTLMQGLYLSLACSLMKAARRKERDKLSGGAWDGLESYETYKAAADRVIGFLNDWFGVAGDDCLVKTFENGSLVHERTPTYAELRDGSYPGVEYYSPDHYWGGDQGLIMGALVQYAELLAAHADGSPESSAAETAMTRANDIMKGVFYNMPATEFGRRNAVGPYDPAWTLDENDYGSGSGVFWRYFLRCCRIDKDFKTSASGDQKIRSMAGTSGTVLNSWGNELFQPFNTVAAAIGAWYLLK